MSPFCMRRELLGVDSSGVVARELYPVTRVLVFDVWLGIPCGKGLSSNEFQVCP